MFTLSFFLPLVFKIQQVFYKANTNEVALVSKMSIHSLTLQTMRFWLSFLSFGLAFESCNEIEDCTLTLYNYAVAT